jgi:23S rRNA (pseudouridine1915-N3)-methyltransferase
MIRIKIFSVGKTKESWLLAALSEYETRLKPLMDIQWIFVKTPEELKNILLKESAFIALTPQAPLLTSEQFCHQLYSWTEKMGSRLSFAIGGAEGLSEETLKKAKGLLSLSPMTFTHQMARLLLLEQIYRATEIYKGSEYHK